LSGNHLNAALPLGVCGVEEASERLEGTLCRMAVQVEHSRGRQFPGAEAMPGGAIDATRLNADCQGRATASPDGHGPRPHSRRWRQRRLRLHHGRAITASEWPDAVGVARPEGVVGIGETGAA
jgi:hypothetical protein